MLAKSKFNAIVYLEIISITISLTSVSVLGTDGNKVKFAIDYLVKYGYLGNPDITGNSRFTPLEVRQALAQFQSSDFLPPTGRITEETIEEMLQPRCGNHDERVEEEYREEQKEMSKRRHFYKLQPGLEGKRRHRRIIRSTIKNKDWSIPKWKKLTLTYRIDKFPNETRYGMTPRVVQNEFDQAFRYWAVESMLHFVKLSDPHTKADISIRFFKGKHGDSVPFDGPGKVLAHGFFPQHGDIHLDEEEKWTIGYKRHHYNLRAVSVHEIGHAIGLPHINDANSVMISKYMGSRGSSLENFQMNAPDIKAVQDAYGARPKKKVKKDMKKPGGRTSPNLCKNIRIDAITMMSNKETYVFHGKYYFRLSRINGNATISGPLLISKTFRGIPNRIDAALSYGDATYFFKGSLCWRVTDFKMDAESPRNISEVFPGMPNKIDAAITWSWNNQQYFFKGKQYWKFDSIKRPTAKKYPADINFNWPGIPDDVEAGFTGADGRTYFFKNRKFWMFHDPDSIVEATQYPKSIDHFFGCTSGKS